MRALDALDAVDALDWVHGVRWMHWMRGAVHVVVESDARHLGNTASVCLRVGLHVAGCILRPKMDAVL